MPGSLDIKLFRKSNGLGDIQFSLQFRQSHLLQSNSGLSNGKQFTLLKGDQARQPYFSSPPTYKSFLRMNILWWCKIISPTCPFLFNQTKCQHQLKLVTYLTKFGSCRILTYFISQLRVYFYHTGHIETRDIFHLPGNTTLFNVQYSPVQYIYWYSSMMTNTIFISQPFN